MGKCDCCGKNINFFTEYNPDVGKKYFCTCELCNTKISELSQKKISLDEIITDQTSPELYDALIQQYQTECKISGKEDKNGAEFSTNKNYTEKSGVKTAGGNKKTVSDINSEKTVELLESIYLRLGWLSFIGVLTLIGLILGIIIAIVIFIDRI